MISKILKEHQLIIGLAKIIISFVAMLLMFGILWSMLNAAIDENKKQPPTIDAIGRYATFSNSDDQSATDMYLVSFDTADAVTVRRNSEWYAPVYKKINDATVEAKLPTNETVQIKVDRINGERVLYLQIDNNIPIILKQ